MLTQLEALKLLDDTIIVFMSDNGHSEEDYQIKVDGHLSGYPRGHNYGANGGGGNTGKWIGAKGSFLEGGIRVPAILSYPRELPKGIVRDQAVTAMDWYPTILKLCALRAPAGVELDGHSVLSLIEDKKAPSQYSVMHWQWQESWMVREGNWKLIVNDKYRPAAEKLDTVYLANLADEQPERKNYARERGDIVERLSRLHEQWQRAVTPKDLAEFQESLP